MNTAPATALLAEDEPLLAAALQAALARAWPALHIVATVGNGADAVEQTLALRPEVLFFDIRMPVMDGLEAAAALAADWPDDGGPLPALVFVTAYDRHALDAFDAQAVDYVLKPVQPGRLAKTVARLQEALALRSRVARGEGASQVPDPTVVQLRRLLDAHRETAAGAGAPTLRMIAATVGPGQGAAVRMVPMGEVLAFDAADKYVRVLTAEREYLIRTPLRELQPQLDRHLFWQVHRGTLVRATAIDTVQRSASGHLTVGVRSLQERFAVSRLYAPLFKPM